MIAARAIIITCDKLLSISYLALEQVLLREAEFTQLVEWEVDAAALQVLSHIPQYVGQLQRNAERQRWLRGVFFGVPIGGAKDRQRHQAHGTRDSVQHQNTQRVSYFPTHGKNE